MDNLFTKEYILKCSNNPDLQNLYEFQEGNYILRKGLGLDLECLCGYRDWSKEIQDVWIPTQIQLQIILKQKRDRFNNMNDLKFDFNMRHCVFKTYCHKILNFLTLNDMWLIFFMRELFGKQWVPESKAWQVR